MEDKYSILEKIDEGSFGDIFTIQRCLDGFVFATKQIEYRGSLLKNEYILGEIECLSKLQHENIIRFVEFYVNPKSVDLILEYAENGNLENYLRERFPLKGIFLRRFAVQILTAIDYCHSCGVAHRDLTPSNVLVTANNVIKLADFGLAVSSVTDKGQEVMCKDYLGNIQYLAPEVLDEIPYNAILADLWSTGMLLFYLLFGNVLLKGTPEAVICKSKEIASLICSYNSSSFARTEKNVFGHIEKLLIYLPKQRSPIRYLLVGITCMHNHSEAKMAARQPCDLVSGMTTVDSL